MKLSPEQRIVMALEAASTFSAGVAPPFLIIQQEAPKPQKAPRKTAAGKVQKKSTAKSSKK
jgi:hypothetical protein